MEVGDRRDSVAHGRFARRECVRRRHLSMSGENRRCILGVSRPCGSQCESALLLGRYGSGVTFVVGITCLRRLEASYLVLFACLLQRCSSRRRSWLLRRCSVRCSSSRAAAPPRMRRRTATPATRRACSRTRSSLPKLSLQGYRFSPGTSGLLEKQVHVIVEARQSSLFPRALGKTARGVPLKSVGAGAHWVLQLMEAGPAAR